MISNRWIHCFVCVEKEQLPENYASMTEGQAVCCMTQYYFNNRKIIYIDRTINSNAFSYLSTIWYDYECA